ncbi:MAG: hypothetical protein OJJ54_17835 [Pseudonocardia sp.]|nr:hypothetical protein [Pseudonocardia sp.]
MTRRTPVKIRLPRDPLAPARRAVRDALRLAARGRPAAVEALAVRSDLDPADAAVVRLHLMAFAERIRRARAAGDARAADVLIAAVSDEFAGRIDLTPTGQGDEEPA